MNDEQMQPLLDTWYRNREVAPRDVQAGVARVMANVPQVHQQGRWWPLPAFHRKAHPPTATGSTEYRPSPIPKTNGPTPTRGFTMFSAVKFMVAGVIVALFGGFLLPGVFTTPPEGEVLPAAVTDSPEPEATAAPQEPTDEEIFQPAPTTTEELLALAVTEEVEPGVFRVVNDGLGPLEYPVDWEVPYDIVAGHDGGIYVLEPGHYARLGSGPYRGTHKGFDWDLAAAFPSDVGVTPDGTVWAVFGSSLYSVPWGSGHETRHLPAMHGPEPIEVTSDGTVWAVWRDDSGTVFGYLGVDGWTVVGEWPFDSGYLRVSDRGEVWAVDHVGWGFFGVHRFVDGAWREEEGSRQYGAFDRADADVGMDGTFWGIRDGHYGDPSGDDRLVRFDGTEWTTFESPDWSRTHVAMRELAEDEWVPDDFGRSQWGEPHVAPDGALWVPSRLGVMERDPDLGGGHRNVCGHGIDGVARFDGETWSRFLQGHCVEAMDIATDGSVLLLASKPDARFPFARTYVITPEAVVASEVEVAESPSVEEANDTENSATTASDILPGVALTVEALEPGVFRVVDDGLRDPTSGTGGSIVAGHDGSVWLVETGDANLWYNDFVRLGFPDGKWEDAGWTGDPSVWPNEAMDVEDFEVAPDGTVWAAIWAWRMYLWSLDREGWNSHLQTTLGTAPIEVTSDGTVWAVWLADPENLATAVFGYLGADGWTVVGEWPFRGDLHASDRGEVWAVADGGGGVHDVHRFVDGAWREEEQKFDRADLGMDGTFWGISEDELVRFDGTEWTTFEPPNWSRTDVAMRELAEDGWVPDDLDRDRWGKPHVAPDGSLWVPQQLGVLGRSPDLEVGRQVVCGHGIDGVARFDGETWSRFLQGRCVEAMDIAADGSVWMLASKSDARFPFARTYVITPEAVAATR